MGINLKSIQDYYKNSIKLGNIELRCYILEDGTRILSGRDIQKSLFAPQYSRGTWLRKFFERKEIVETFNPDLINKMKNPIRFIRVGSGTSQLVTYGYEATIFINLCEAILNANEVGLKFDKKLVSQVETIISSVSKSGINDLIDEATGYKNDTNRIELQNVLRTHLSETLLKWQSSLPDSFYVEMFRLKGWDYNLKNIQNKAKIIGTLTNNLIYSQLPEKILLELKIKAPNNTKSSRNYHYQQLLIENTGNSHLSHQITAVVTLMRASKNWSFFEKLFNRVFGIFSIEEFENENHAHRVKEEELNQYSGCFVQKAIS